MNKIEQIVIHCSASPFGDRKFIRQIHVVENGWKDIGYNAIIKNGLDTYKSLYDKKKDGLIVEGRSLDFNAYIDPEEIGAHTLGYNKKTIGICMIGETQFTIAQFRSLYYMIKIFKNIQPDILIKGHYEMPTAGAKTCPNFDMDKFREIMADETPRLDARMFEAFDAR